MLCLSSGLLYIVIASCAKQDNFLLLPLCPSIKTSVEKNPTVTCISFYFVVAVIMYLI